MRHAISGKDITTKERALEAFYELMRTANGTRRQAPEDFVKVEQVRCKEGGWVVHYSVPSRIVREIVRPSDRKV